MTLGYFTLCSVPRRGEQHFHMMSQNKWFRSCYRQQIICSLDKSWGCVQCEDLDSKYASPFPSDHFQDEIFSSIERRLTETGSVTRYWQPLILKLKFTLRGKIDEIFVSVMDCGCQEQHKFVFYYCHLDGFMTQNQKRNGNKAFCYCFQFG